MDADKVEISPGKMLSHLDFDRKSKEMAPVAVFQDTFYKGKNSFKLKWNWNRSCWNLRKIDLTKFNFLQ